MVVLENGKMKIDNPRFRVNVVMQKSNLPDCDIKDDIYIVKDKEFFTLRDIAEYLNISYHIAVGIYKKKTQKGGKWIKSPLCPTIDIIKISN